MKPNISLDPSQPRIIQFPKPEVVSNFYVSKLALTIGSTIQIIDTDQISHFQSENNYTRIILVSEKIILSSKTMKRFEDRIDTTQFLRVHNSFIINVLEISSFDTSENRLELKDGSNIPVSRSRKSTLIQYLKNLMV